MARDAAKRSTAYRYRTGNVRKLASFDRPIKISSGNNHEDGRTDKGRRKILAVSQNKKTTN